MEPLQGAAMMPYFSPLLFEPGDHMSRSEFLEFWRRMPDLKFTELIDGCVYMPGVIPYQHGCFNAQSTAWWVCTPDDPPFAPPSATPRG